MVFRRDCDDQSRQWSPPSWKGRVPEERCSGGGAPQRASEVRDRLDSGVSERSVELGEGSSGQVPTAAGAFDSCRLGRPGPDTRLSACLDQGSPGHMVMKRGARRGQLPRTHAAPPAVCVLRTSASLLVLKSGLPIIGPRLLLSLAGAFSVPFFLEPGLAASLADKCPPCLERTQQV